MKIGGAKIVFLGSAPLPLRRRGDAILDHDEILAGVQDTAQTAQGKAARGAAAAGARQTF